jgi:heme oxygenase
LEELDFMANNLKELTWEHHKSAERTEFTQILLGGEISPELYHKYLCSQLICYTALEEAVTLPEEYQSVFRQTGLEEDIAELESIYGIEPWDDPLTAVVEYVDHIGYLAKNNDNDGLLAHLYVRHFGDMSGGQIIRTKVPGDGTFYDFEDIDALKSGIRGLLHNEMAVEAGICFQYAEQMFGELLDTTPYYFNTEYAMSEGLPYEPADGEEE